jgi:Zn-dependent peptidase ImmA (M78 family)
MTGTIIIDASLLGEEQHHRRRFTISHELSHWIIHRQMHYSDNQLQSSDNSPIYCLS